MGAPGARCALLAARSCAGGAAGMPPGGADATDRGAVPARVSRWVRRSLWSLRQTQAPPARPRRTGAGGAGPGRGAAIADCTPARRPTAARASRHRGRPGGAHPGPYPKAFAAKPAGRSWPARPAGRASCGIRATGRPPGAGAVFVAATPGTSRISCQEVAQALRGHRRARPVPADPGAGPMRRVGPVGPGTPRYRCAPRGTSRGSAAGPAGPGAGRARRSGRFDPAGAHGLAPTR